MYRRQGGTGYVLYVLRHLYVNQFVVQLTICHSFSNGCEVNYGNVECGWRAFQQIDVFVLLNRSGSVAAFRATHMINRGMWGGVRTYVYSVAIND